MGKGKRFRQDCQLEELMATKEELIETWMVRAEYEKQEKKGAMKRCRRMQKSVNFHGVNIINRLDGAKEAMKANLGVIPLSVINFIRYCDHLADQLGVQGIEQVI